MCAGGSLGSAHTIGRQASSSLSAVDLFSITLATLILQAEDGIRDIGVTGVQTCALPIFGECRLEALPRLFRRAPADGSVAGLLWVVHLHQHGPAALSAHLELDQTAAHRAPRMFMPRPTLRATVASGNKPLVTRLPRGAAAPQTDPRSGFTHEPGGSLIEDCAGRSPIEAIGDERYDRKSSGVLRRAR